jgi:hypothetical protein
MKALELSYVTGGEAGFSALNVGLRVGPRSGGSSSDSL